MDAEGTGLSSAADVIAEDDGALNFAAVHSRMSRQMLLGRQARASRALRRRRYCGSVPGRRPNERRDLAAGLLNIP